jgi:glutamyl-tRNA synthetase
MSVRVRFAPSPTGYLHVGGARTALYNYLFAKHSGGKFILRIEDTDKERSTKESIDAILSGLKWLGILWDEGPEAGGEYGPYFQSQREDTYAPYIEKLLASKNAYKCFCSKEELDAIREEARINKKPIKYDGRCRKLSDDEIKEKENTNTPYVIRLKVPENDIIFNDLIRGEVKTPKDILDDFILVRSDGSFVYNFVVTIDDLTMKISHVIRGEDHISNTPKQVAIFSLLGETPPEYAHIPLILGKDKKRLSKRHGATSTEEYKKCGYPVEAFINYLALVGWAYDDKTTIFSRDELIKYFSLDKVSKSGGVFDEDKLNWMSGMYIREMDNETLYKSALPFLKDGGIDVSDESFTKNLLLCVREKLKVLSEAPSMLGFFFKELPYEEKAEKGLLKISDKLDLFESYINFIKATDFSSAEDIETKSKEFIESAGYQMKDIMLPLRASLSFKTSGPSLFDIIFYLGKDKVLERLLNALSFVKSKTL